MLAKDPACRAGRILVEHRQQHVLDRDVLVAQAAGLLQRAVEQLVEAARDVHLPRRRARAGHARPALEVALERLAHGLVVHLGPREQARDQAVALVEEGQQQVLDVGLGVAEPQGLRLRLLDGLLRPLGQRARVHVTSS